MKFRSCDFLVFYLCVYIFLVEGFGGLSRAGSLTGTKSIKSGQKKNTDSRLTSDSKQANRGDENKTSKGGSKRYLSAWGIISLITLVIVGSLLIYYVSIFYPLVCAKRGKYDVMEMTEV